LHNHKGHRHVRVRRGSIHTLKTQRCKKKFTASEIFFALRVARAALPASPRCQGGAPSIRAASIRRRNERFRSALTGGDALGRHHRQPRPRREHAARRRLEDEPQQLRATQTRVVSRHVHPHLLPSVAALSFQRTRTAR
jgi:hypothetical protein